ncbi:MAG: hypothetical protein KY397_07315 [Gemmatimonadetes bacterium]|nr:hypothetical protein [Gemmatimonadota bacterium]
MSPTALAGLAIASVVSSAGVVWLVRTAAGRRGWLDVPNRRSLHEGPIPRGGGIGIVAVLIPVLAGLALTGFMPLRLAAGAVAMALTTLVGGIDDVRTLNIAPRLLTHVAAGVLVAWIALQVPVEPFHLGLSEGALVVWWMFWTVSTINVVNFMDGTDGLVGLQAVVFGLFLLLAGDSTVTLVFAVSLTGAALGFLLFNWSPASIFLGDSGSGALAIAMVLGGIFTLQDRSWSIFHAFLPLMPLFADALTTTIHRAWRGEKLWIAHRTHVYQLLVQGGWSHARVALLYGAASVACSYWALSSSAFDETFLTGGAILLSMMIAGLEIVRARVTRQIPYGDGRKDARQTR